MTDDIFDLGQCLIVEPNPESPRYLIGYAEFVETLEELTETLAELPETDVFTEAKVQPVKGALKRSKELTHDTMKAYGDVTGGAGDVIHGGAKLSLKLIGLSTKLINFVCKMITVLPVTMTKMIDDLTRVSGNAISSITGKMRIYLTIESLDLFDKEIKEEIDHFIRICSIFSDGDQWATNLFASDFSRYKQMKKISNKLAAIRYEPSVVNSKTDRSAEVYFDPEGEYYSRLKSLNDFFKSKKADLEKLRDALKTKIADTENSGNFYKLNPAQRLKVEDSVKMIGQFMSVVGKYFQYVQQDLLTIQGQLKQRGKLKAKATAKADASSIKTSEGEPASKGPEDGT